jgi:hypothetical protein
MPWWEKYNQIQTIVPGEQSVLYPNAVPGWWCPAIPGIPSTLVAIAVSQLRSQGRPCVLSPTPPWSSGSSVWRPGKSSIRASYGMFYTAFPGLTAGIMYGVPPYGYNYLSPEPPLLATPFINSADGAQNTDPFPLNFPPHNVSAQNPYTGFNFAAVTPISADPYFYYRNSVPLHRKLHAFISAADRQQHAVDGELRGQ